MYLGLNITSNMFLRIILSQNKSNLISYYIKRNTFIFKNSITI